MTASGNWWSEVEGPTVLQGDLLPRCLVPAFSPDYGRAVDPVHAVPVAEANCIVLSQSCDLEQLKVRFVALCPVFTLSELQENNRKYKEASALEEIRKGRVHLLHMIAGPDDASDNKRCRVVYFDQIYSLPIAYVTGHAALLGRRSRLNSPYLEHLSQAFARFFMRVGLPSAIAPFRS